MRPWLVAGLLAMAFSGCAEAPGPAAPDDVPWLVHTRTCGDTPVPMTHLLVIYAEGRLVHFNIWQGGYSEDEAQDDGGMTAAAAHKVALEAEQTGVFALDAYRPPDDPQGRPEYAHREERTLSPGDLDDLRRLVEEADFPGLAARYDGGADTTEGGQACGQTVGAWHDDAWPKSRVSPLEAAPDRLRDLLVALDDVHPPSD